MNRIQRIAAAAAVSTAVLAPATAAMAYAEPIAPTQDQTEQLLRLEQQYMQESEPADEELLRQEQQYMQDRQWAEPAAESSGSDNAATSFPWDTVGFVTLGAAALAAGSVIVVRRGHRVPKHA